MPVYACVFVFIAAAVSKARAVFVRAHLRDAYSRGHGKPVQGCCFMLLTGLPGAHPTRMYSGAASEWYNVLSTFFTRQNPDCLVGGVALSAKVWHCRRLASGSTLSSLRMEH